MKRTSILWITALALGWLFDFLFWKHGVGINFAIYVVLCLAGGSLVLGLNKIKPSWKSLLLLIPILFFAVMTFIRREPMSLFLSFVATLGLMGVLAITFLGGNWARYSLADYVVNYARLIGSMFARPLMFLAEKKKLAAAGQAEGATAGAKSAWKRTWAILRGILIALPIVAIFAGLLSSADLVFAQRLHDFTDLFRLARLPEYIFRCAYILAGAYALAGVILHAAQKSQDEELVGAEKPAVAQFLGFTEATIVLGAVVALFAIFVIIQFQYFFGGRTNVGVEGYTFAEYARRGFGELVAVALFSLLLLLGLGAITKRKEGAQRWAFSGLGVGMVALVGVMLVSAFQRLLLYESAYGFSRLRFYTHVFMIWLGALLAVVIVLEILRRERFFALAAILASIGFVATLTIVNVDGYIVRQNVARATTGEGFDVPYLASLSADAVPVLVDEFQSSSLPGMTRDAVGAVLACYTTRNPDRQDIGWGAFTLAGRQAEKALETVRTKLDKYKVLDEDWPVQIFTPGNVMYECYESGVD